MSGARSTRDVLATTIGNGDPMHCAQDPPAETTAHGNSKTRGKKNEKEKTTHCAEKKNSGKKQEGTNKSCPTRPS